MVAGFNLGNHVNHGCLRILRDSRQVPKQAKRRDKGNLAQSVGAKSNLGSHFCMGEASGTKGVTPESTTRVSFVEEGASDLEYQGESLVWSWLGSRMASVVGILMVPVMIVRFETR
ncbi:hypothetical protein FCV25MIE_21547 [Fagus crenata]